MASLTGQTVSSTYDGLLKTDDNDILGAAPKEITDGLGNGSGMTLSTTGDVSIAGDLTVDGAILDSNGVPGASGQILSSTVTGTDWVSLSEISGVDGSGTANYIAKWTDGDTIGNSVIYDNGTNVGIGTGVPTEKIQVVGNGLFTGNVGLGVAPLTALGNKRLTIYEASSTSLVLSNSNNFVNIFNGSTVGDPTSIFSNTGFKFATASDASATGFSEKMRIDSAGNVGIGTIPSNARLDVKSTGNQAIYAITDGGWNALEFTSDNGTTVGGLNAFNGIIKIGTANAIGSVTGAINIDSSGNVGIGTSSPSEKLYIEGSTPNIMISNTAETESGIIFQDSAGGTQVSSIKHNSSNNSLIFSTALQERMRITSAGNVGIGTATPSQLLHITSAGSTVMFVEATGANDSRVRITAGDSNISYLEFGDTTDSDTGEIRYDHSDDSMQFRTNANTERMRITSGGNVGIGTSSPSGNLHVKGTGVVSLIAQSSGSDAVVRLINTTASTGKNYYISSTNVGNLSFVSVTDGERMRITSGGDVLIGTTTTAATAGIVITPNNSAGAATMFFNRNATTSTSYIQDFRNGGATVGFIAYNNSSVTYATSSDYRLKEDWQPMANALDRVEALKPINFAWKADGSRVDGFLAHELAEVIPEAVTGEKDAIDEEGNPIYQGIDQSKIVPLLTAALQEANQMIKELTTRIETLENK